MFQGWGKSLAGRSALALTLIVGASAALSASIASADVQVCTPSVTPKCASPRGLATDFASGLLYVADNGNNRIDIFEEGGAKPATPSSFGGVTAPVWIAVDNNPTSASQHDIYATEGFKVKKFEPNGTLAKEFGEQGDGTPEGCQIERENDPIAVGPGGVVYLADSYNTTPLNPESTSIWANRVIKFDAEGKCVGTVSLFVETNKFIRDLVVDSVGAVYVTVPKAGGLIRQYSPAGTLTREFESLESSGLAIDGKDHLFAEQRGEDVLHTRLTHFFTEYSSGGTILRRFAYAPGGIPGSPGLAALHTTGGDLFASNDETGVTYFKEPPAGPVLFPAQCHVKGDTPGSVRATLQAEVNPEGKATTFSFEYEPLGGGGAPFENAVSSPPVSLAAGATDFELHEATQSVDPLEAETEYRCRIVAKNADSSGEGTVGEEGTFKTNEPFTFGPAWSSEVSETTATINAEGNPNGAPWTGQIEYITDAQYQANGETFAGARLSTPPMDYGESEGVMVLRSTGLSGLSPNTLYHYRLRAFNADNPEGLVCPNEEAKQGRCPALERTFRTHGPEESPDNRGYELVSSGETNSADLVGPRNTRGLVINYPIQIKASSPSGESATYTSWTSFGEAEGAPATSQYLSHRTPTGWVTENVSPGGFQPKIQIPPYLGISPDLRFGVAQATKTPLAPGCPAGPESLYLNETDTNSNRCLTPEHPNTVNEFGYCFNYGGTSADGSRVFFQSSAPYANAPTNSGVSLYEFHEGQIKVVSVLPGKTEPATPAANTSFGARNSEQCQNGQTILHNAISADGSKAIWTYVPTSGTSQLLDRVNGEETIQLDKSQGGGSSGEGLYWAASENGRVVYFTSPRRLLKNVKAEPGHEDLYRYDFSAEEPLSDVTFDGAKPAPGDVRGVLGASEDGKVVYYVAGTALTPEDETNEAGQHAEAGKNNLYRYDAGEGKNHFIAQLSGEDNRDWETQPTFLTARVSPDGQHLAFLSVEAKALAGYDNTLAATEGKFAGQSHCQLAILSDDILTGSNSCPEAFVYDAGSGKLTCASCNPSGSRPLGPTLFPSWSSMSEGPRVISDNGQRIFFESFDAISGEDENNKRDVYEFELPGSGTCTTANPSYDPAHGGCHFLISSGQNPDESYLVDASSSGRDAFFSTRSQLVGWDTNDHYDVYDYREGGGFPEPPPVVPPCEGEGGCKAPATSPPAAPAPATPSFNGPGNPKPKPAKHKKKHHKKKNKKAKHKKHHAKKKGKANR
jgi:Tol biopolymer transport system component